MIDGFFDWVLPLGVWLAFTHHSSVGLIYNHLELASPRTGDVIRCVPTRNYLPIWKMPPIIYI